MGVTDREGKMKFMLGSFPPLLLYSFTPLLLHFIALSQTPVPAQLL